jgi:NAD(P)H-hydrate epimerase
MTEIVLPTLDREQIGQVERLLEERFGVVPLQTMENAGRNLAWLVSTLLEGDLADRPLVVLAGRGCNGGGGLAAARHLLNWGAWVQVVCSHPADAYQDASAQQLHTLHEMGAPLAWAEEGWELPPCDLLIDALIGTNLRGEPRGKVRELIQLANSSVAPIVSLEAPSGVDAASGELFTPHVRASATLVLGLPKSGVLVNDARRVYGDLYLGDAGAPLALYEEVGVDTSNLVTQAIFSGNPFVRWDVVDDVTQVIDLG